MKVIVKVLAVFGVLAILLVIGIVTVALQSANHQEEAEVFLTSVTGDLSSSWDPASIADQSTSSFLAQATSPDGMRALMQFHPLGKLTTAHEFELEHYSDATDGVVGKYAFKASFENGSAVILAVVHGEKEKMKLHGFQLNILDLNHASKQAQPET